VINISYKSLAVHRVRLDVWGRIRSGAWKWKM